MTSTRISRLIPAVAIALVLAACGGAAVDSGNGDAGAADHVTSDADHAEDGHAEDGHSEEAFTFGEPAEASEADRTIEVIAQDDFTFSPSAIDISAGETITFVVSNRGNLPHDFTLGDAKTQDTHDAEMAEMMASGQMMAHDDANAVVLEPGETKELTWRFSEEGTFLIGCHQPGHYAAGMKATIDVQI